MHLVYILYILIFILEFFICPSANRVHFAILPLSIPASIDYHMSAVRLSASLTCM